jgi:hypothetical protein
MRYRTQRIVTIAFLALLVVVLVSQPRGVKARPCTAIETSSASSPGRDVIVHNAAPCVRSYLTAGPLYNPMFTYSDSSLSFGIPAMMWSGLRKVVFVSATRAKVAPNTTTYWFLRVPDSSTTGKARGFGSFVSSTSPMPRQDELLEYVVVSNKSGIAWVRFPLGAQLRQFQSADPSSDQANLAGSDLTEVVAQANVGIQTDSSGDGFFNGAVVANAAVTPSPLFTGTSGGAYYGDAVIAQALPTSTGAGVPYATAQPGSMSVTGGLTVDAGAKAPGFKDGQVAVGFGVTSTASPILAGAGLRGLFTAGTAGKAPNAGDGVLTFGNNTGDVTWTQIGASGGHHINGVHNTVFSVLEEVEAPTGGHYNQIGCAMDAGSNWGCGGGLFGNAGATPFPPTPKPGDPPPPTPGTYPSSYGGPAVIAQNPGGIYPLPPTAQPGNVLINGTIGALGIISSSAHNTCSASSGVPCGFTWTITPTSGSGSVNVPVPASSVCTISATQSPYISGSDVVTMWAGPLSGTTLTVNVKATTGVDPVPWTLSTLRRRRPAWQRRAPATHRSSGVEFSNGFAPAAT